MADDFGSCTTSARWRGPSRRSPRGSSVRKFGPLSEPRFSRASQGVAVGLRPAGVRLDQHDLQLGLRRRRQGDPSKALGRDVAAQLQAQRVAIERECGVGVVDRDIAVRKRDGHAAHVIRGWSGLRVGEDPVEERRRLAPVVAHPVDELGRVDDGLEAVRPCRASSTCAAAARSADGRRRSRAARSSASRRRASSRRRPASSRIFSSSAPWRVVVDRLPDRGQPVATTPRRSRRRPARRPRRSARSTRWTGPVATYAP